MLLIHGIVAVAVSRALALVDLSVEPFGLEAGAEVPMFISFSTGALPCYGHVNADDGSTRMALAIELSPVVLGRNNDCQGVLEATGFPPMRRCLRGPEGGLLLELRRALDGGTRYDLLLLGTLPGVGETIQQLHIRVLPPGPHNVPGSTVSFEEATLVLAPAQVVVAPTAKHVTSMALISPAYARQGTMLQQYTFEVVGSQVPFAAGDQLRIYSSPFFYEDEGLSFGGACEGFEMADFASPLQDVACKVTSIPVDDARVGYNTFTLTFGASATLAQVPQYFRIAVNTPKQMGSMGYWYVASKDSSHQLTFSKVISAVSPFIITPLMSVTSAMPAPPIPTYGATQLLTISILPRINIIGNSAVPPKIAIRPPAFQRINFCENIGHSPVASLVSLGTETHCVLQFQSSHNLYMHQSISVRLDVINPTFAMAVEAWLVTLESDSTPVIASASFLGWPVYASLRQAFLTPMTMEYASWNELQIFFSPSMTSPPESCVIVTAPAGFLFEDPCAFEVIAGFPHQGLQCSNPLSGLGRNLFSLRMPMTTPFVAGRSYAANIYPLRNPYLGGHGEGLDSLPWQIDLVAADGSTVLETSRGVPMGPHLRGFQIYPISVFDPIVIPDLRTPNKLGPVTIRFRVAVNVAAHGERLLITAPYGFRWEAGGPIELHSGGRAVQVAALPYDAFTPPVVPPHNQIELTLVDPRIPAGSDVRVRGHVRNALIDSTLNREMCSANIWAIEMYEPGAGYLEYRYRHQAAVIPGFWLQAITGGSVVAWLPVAQHTQMPVMVTFRLGTPLLGQAGRASRLEVQAPGGFFFPMDCAAQLLSPVHLPVDGYHSLLPGTIAECRGSRGELAPGAEQIAQVILAASSEVVPHRLYAFLLEVVVPEVLPRANTWALRSFVGAERVEEQTGIEGFQLTVPFLSAAYHPGTSDTGEDLRVGASNNKVMFSVQPASMVAAGGELRITAPHRFSFARKCRPTVYAAEHILDTLDDTDDSVPDAETYHDLPTVTACLGIRNMAHMTMAEVLDVGIRYAFRIAVANPTLPHPTEWPLKQDVWRFETFDLSGALLNAAEVHAFFLWAFVQASITPLSVGAAEETLMTVDVEPSMTVPPRGSLLVAAPPGFGLPVPCTGFQRDTHSQSEGSWPLPLQTECSRGMGGHGTLRLRLDGRSHLVAWTRYRFRLGVVNPAVPTVVGSSGEPWSLATMEEAQEGEAFLERNPAVAGYSLHQRLEAFAVSPSTRLAGRRATATLGVALPESLGMFEVLSMAELAYVAVDMPVHFSVPVDGGSEVPAGGGAMLHRCEVFLPVYPDPRSFPVRPDGCLALPGRPAFRLQLARSLVVGPDYTFQVGILHPTLTSSTQRELALANVWQVRLVRIALGRETTSGSRAVEGYHVEPLLHDCLLRPDIALLSIRSKALLSLAFQIVSELSGSASDLLRIIPPATISALDAPSNGSAPCQLWVDRVMQPSQSFLCRAVNGSLRVHLQDALTIAEGAKVQVDFEIYSGTTPLSLGDVLNQWSVASLEADGDVKDQMPDLPGFVVFSSLERTAVIPEDVTAMSFRNHAEFRFQAVSALDSNAYVTVTAPAGFALYPQTFRASGLQLSDGFEPPRAHQDGSSAKVVISLTKPLEKYKDYSFHLTIGNPAVSPPENYWLIEVRDAANATLCLNSRIPGFLVESKFNTSLVLGQTDEPLAENYVHVTVAVRQRLLASAVFARNACVASPEEPLCPPRQGLSTFLVLTAPEGFSFQPTCGFWVLLRVGSRHRGLPPGSLCRADGLRQNVARLQLSRSLEPLQLYEFSLQVRNALSVPLENLWTLQATQDGVPREQEAGIQGFPLRTLRTARLVPSTTLAGATHNSVTVQLRSERPVARGSSILLVAPAGFSLEAQSVIGSFPHPILAENPDPPGPNAVRVWMSLQDFVPPNVHFLITVHARNPLATPDPNFWYVYLQTQSMQHIDLRKFIPGFLIAQRMRYCQVYPNSVPWHLGTSNEISMLFVTRSPVFTSRKVQSDLATPWQIVLVAPSGFSFSSESKYSQRCSGFRRWGGKDSYDQLPDISNFPLTCNVETAHHVQIKVPVSIFNETRYSFRINVTAAEQREDIDLQSPWRLTILNDEEILHVGNSPSPLLGKFFVPEWLWVPGTTGLSTIQDSNLR